MNQKQHQAAADAWAAAMVRHEVARIEHRRAVERVREARNNPFALQEATDLGVLRWNLDTKLLEAKNAWAQACLEFEAAFDAAQSAGVAPSDHALRPPVPRG